MKKTRLKKLGHLYATDEMLCMAEQDIPENTRLGGKELSLSSSERYICRVKFVTVFWWLLSIWRGIYGWEV